MNLYQIRIEGGNDAVDGGWSGLKEIQSEMDDVVNIEDSSMVRTVRKLKDITIQQYSIISYLYPGLVSN